jgi:7-carboxy-7-deazaguanine synthase
MIKHSEIFYSIQGEGTYTGNLTTWLRFSNCNLQCNGFGQKDPTDPSTYSLPYLEIDAYKYKNLEELPVFERGCDSSYSWSAKFDHLQHREPVDVVARKLIDVIPNNNKSFNVTNGNDVHLCFTGGEPLLPINQKHFTQIIKYYIDNKIKLPKVITFETNGTQMLSSQMIDTLNLILNPCQNLDTSIFWSISPKLYNITGESSQRAFNPPAIHVLQAANINQQQPRGQLKFVINDSDAAWREMEEKIDYLQQVFQIDFPVWVMPVGALDQQQYNMAEKVALRALDRGYHVSARVHTYLFGNKIGT